jgi:hypothetical protein
MASAIAFAALTLITVGLVRLIVKFGTEPTQE